MKKLVSIIAVAGVFALISCGPSADEKAKAEKAKADSTRIADSTKTAQQAAMMKMKQDSASKAAAMKSDSTKKDSAKKM